MIKKNIFKSILLVLFLAMMAGVLYYANYDRPRYISYDNQGIEYETARVLSVIENQTTVDTTNENVLKGSMELKLEILTGRYKGDIAFVTNYFSATYSVEAYEGDTISVRIDTSDVGKYSVSVYNYNRTPILIALIALFLLALILVGGWQGVKAFVGLGYTVICIFFILLPLVLKGYSPILVTCIIIGVTSIVCFLLIGGIQSKTVIAAIGSMCGVLCAAFLAQIFSHFAGVTVFQMDEAEALLITRSSFPIHMRGLFISGILIAAMGAVMDVSMTISSALDELHQANPKIGKKNLFGAGMRIGRDAMGTMANTLVLAYVGSSLNMMVLIYSYGVTWRQLLNTDFVGIEIIRAVAGSIGIVLTVPCVAFISAIGLVKRKKLN